MPQHSPTRCNRAISNSTYSGGQSTSLVAGKVGDTVFANGGSTDGLNQVNVNESYKISSDSWSTTPAAMPTPRSEAGVHSHGGRVYVVGGGNRGISTDAKEVFKPNP